jgi:histone H3/H4
MLRRHNMGRKEYGRVISASRLGALQEATEHTVLQMLQISNLAAIHVKRVTLMPQDMQFIRLVFGIHDADLWLAKDW